MERINAALCTDIYRYIYSYLHYQLYFTTSVIIRKPPHTHSVSYSRYSTGTVTVTSQLLRYNVSGTVTGYHSAARDSLPPHSGLTVPLTQGAGALSPRTSYFTSKTSSLCHRTPQSNMRASTSLSYVLSLQGHFSGQDKGQNSGAQRHESYSYTGRPRTTRGVSASSGGQRPFPLMTSPIANQLLCPALSLSPTSDTPNPFQLRNTRSMMQSCLLVPLLSLPLLQPPGS